MGNKLCGSAMDGVATVIRQVVAKNYVESV